MKVIREPTKKLLDDCLERLIHIIEDYKTIIAQYYEAERAYEQAVNDALSREDIKYKTEAEARVKTKTDKYDTYIEKKVQKYQKEEEKSAMRLVYYHARDQLLENREADVEASKMGAL